MYPNFCCILFSRFAQQFWISAYFVYFDGMWVWLWNPIQSRSLFSSAAIHFDIAYLVSLHWLLGYLEPLSFGRLFTLDICTHWSLSPLHSQNQLASMSPSLLYVAIAQLSPANKWGNSSSVRNNENDKCCCQQLGTHTYPISMYRTNLSNSNDVLPELIV